MAKTETPNIFAQMADADPEVLDAIFEGLRPFAEAVNRPAPRKEPPPQPTNIFAQMANADPAVMDVILEGLRPWAEAVNGPAKTASAPQPKS